MNRVIIAAVFLIAAVSSASAEVGNQWDMLVQSQGEYWDTPPGKPRVHSRSLSGITPALAAKVHQIVSACGSKVISSLRNTRVRGSGRISLHASGRAVDVQGNPSCIYASLHGWPGGYSIDYARVKHVHISYSPNGREWGARFNHYGGSHHAKRHKHHRHARAWHAPRMARTARDEHVVRD